MPRDLTDLMERATSFAPPEPHDAADITLLAARRQRRRTTGIAGALAVAVLAVGGIGYDATRGHDTTPQPAGPWKYGRTITLSDVRPATSLPGYHVEPWTVPSVDRFGSKSGLAPLPTYESVDSHGRLIVIDLPSGHYPGEKPVSGSYRARLFNRPGQPPATLQAPGDTAPGKQWLPTFTGDGRLLWSGDQPELHVTNRAGAGDIELDLRSPDGDGASPGDVWVDGDRYWFATTEQSHPFGTGVPYNDVYTATIGHPLVRIADDAVLTGESDGTVAWLTTGGQVMAETPSTAKPFGVHVPLDPGCSLTPVRSLQNASTFAVGPSFVALTERCGSGSSENDELLVFDLGGREIVHSTGLDAFHPSVAGNTLLIGGYDPRTSENLTLRYDLVTGSLVSLAAPQKQQEQRPQGAGDYVLWYDKAGGHVARIPQ